MTNVYEFLIITQIRILFSEFRISMTSMVGEMTNGRACDSALVNQVVRISNKIIKFKILYNNFLSMGFQ